MNYSTLHALLLATPGLQALAPFAQPLMENLQQLAEKLQHFQNQPLTPQTTYDLEQQLAQQARSLARDLLQEQLNALEPPDTPQTPPRLFQDGNRYRRRDKSKNTIATLFGSIILSRFLYEPDERGERCIHPLEQRLGIVAGCATPALAERAGLAAAKEPQRQALQRLEADHDVHWSQDTYRKVTAALAEQLNPHRQPAQVDKVLSWLEQAQNSKGRYRPVLAVGRDGIHVPMLDGEYHEGATATLSVFNRRGKRLGTVYLGQMPEAGQPTLSQQLTDLIQEVLRLWEGPQPRLAYVTDAGYHPSEYYRRELRKMKDPRHPGQRLLWERVVDLYHAYGYVTQLAEALFGKSKAGQAWARRMRRQLRDRRRGSTRVLQSAAWQRNQRELSAAREESYEKASGYLRRQGRFMDYTGYKRRGLPLGSGVTEAACKTVFAQRLKLSGMRWGREGGQVVLDLRVLWLSGVWKEAFTRYLRHQEENLNDTYAMRTQPEAQNAA